MAQQDDVFGLDDEQINGKAPPSQKFVDWFHKRVSTTKASDFHHALGTGPTEAASGDHNHDGKNSVRLWDETTVLTDLDPAATLAQVITAVNKLNEAIRIKGAAE
ncbi:MAG: hypothetical protein K0R99_4304 [Microbacterium sp.]|jgi:hypothetical protein|uniref:hypothetical protein n=1 Tax=Microbacterium sp. TaxID=51671 RepID=UPI002632DDD2|nr:hypothetical protein [Microbacterium sp.]MDF2562858.1 hypothetical protein [Microbacterium sp.]